MTQRDWLKTRRSLINRLKDWEDEASWREFLDLYGRLIFHLARRSGLDVQEAEEAVQETLIATAKAMPRFRYNPAVGSFKSWLFQLTRWKIQDRFRQRKRDQRTLGRHGVNRAGSATQAKALGLDDAAMQRIWEAEWEECLVKTALNRLRPHLNPKHYQIFDLHVVRQWPAEKVAEAMQISTAQVYLAKSRIAAQLKEEIVRLQRGNF